MAIFNAVPPPPELTTPNPDPTSAQPQPQPQPSHPSQPHHQHHPSTSTVSVDIEAWTVSALESLSISPAVRGSGGGLSIPLDVADAPVAKKTKKPSAVTGAGVKARFHAARRVDVGDGNEHEDDSAARLMRRDSMRKREMVLRGREGTRQRRRWENDHFIGVPNAQPPLPIDYEPRPTHPVTHVPYALAHFWDRGVRELAEERRNAAAAARKQHQGFMVRPAAARADIGKVPRELRAKAKKTPAVKGWLRGLEEPVRRFLVERGCVDRSAAAGNQDGHASDEDMDSDDEEIVFVGRDGATRDGRDVRGAATAPSVKPAHRPGEVGMVFDDLGDDQSGAFKRWLAHSISLYYGLDSASVLVGTPARKVVYISIKDTTRHEPRLPRELPRPLWDLF